MADRYALIGHPVGQSLSPKIHAQFAAQTGHDIRYELLDVEPGRFEAAVAEFRDAGGKGLNVTLPHKTAAHALAGRASVRAQAAQAANTLIFDGDGVAADNTDGVGMVRDLQRHAFTIQGRVILILGAGGACRGIIQPLFEAGAREIFIANRTAERAGQVAEALGEYGAVRAIPNDAVAKTKCDAVVNATSASLSGQVPATPPPDNLQWGYDLAYAKSAGEKTAFVAWLEARKVPAHDGYGMLIEQAAESFYLWRGVRPQTDALTTRRITDTT